jgi:hypothetical protein
MAARAAHGTCKEIDDGGTAAMTRFPLTVAPTAGFLTLVAFMLVTSLARNA